MKSAKQIANDMADAVNIDSNLVRGFTQGFISVPVDFYYLGYDYIDTENRWLNSQDKERFIRLIKSGLANKASIEKVAHIFIENFASKVKFEDVKDMTIRTSGKLIGKFAFNQLATANMGYIFSKQIIPRLVSGVAVGSILTAGASISRSVYTSRDLRARNSRVYDQLRRLGNLDLLYFLLENKVRPFEDAVSVWERDRKKFNQICQYFFAKVNV
ncbi:hypothetical protein [Serratia marcescens]|uniref:hypothetical protein n=1 Tax=Serratia marcescens TaxID=615 RepID=UPI0018D5C346|nr:hypothetical protein [Serratia marcescens]MBH3126017.1 hypothetical protein [Serratia marcescens]